MTTAQIEEFNPRHTLLAIEYTGKRDNHKSIYNKAVFPIRFKVLVGKCMQKLKKYAYVKYMWTVYSNIRSSPFILHFFF